MRVTYIFANGSQELYLDLFVLVRRRIGGAAFDAQDVSVLFLRLI